MNTVAELCESRTWSPGHGATTVADQAGPVRVQGPRPAGPELLLRDKPNQAWVGDLTEIPNDEGPLYLLVRQP
jgi:hypothetical protein